MSSNKLKVIPFDVSGIRPPSQSSISYRAHANRAAKRDESLFTKMLSIRVVLVSITILTVLCMGIILVYISVDAQHNIAGVLSSRIQKDVAEKIGTQLDGIFQFTEDELYAGLLPFSTDNETAHLPYNANPLILRPKVMDFMWSLIRKRPFGIEVEFDFVDGRYYGVESFNDEVRMFWVDKDNISDTLIARAYRLRLNQTIESATGDDPYEVFRFPEGTTMITRPHDDSCRPTAQWYNVVLYILNGLKHYLMFCVIEVCDPNTGKYAGFLGSSISIEYLQDFLKTITEEFDGKIFIMNAKKELVSSSTGSEIFNIYENDDPTHVDIFNTTERWIQDVVRVMDGDYGEQQRSVTINGTKYYLTVTHYDSYTGVNWYIVKLFTQKQFNGNIQSYFVNSLIAAISVMVTATTVVIIVSWAMTNPLFILASDLQKMSRLDLESTEMKTPRLLEVGRLYRSVATMYVALQSFKKFVPVQVITKILKSEKEVTAELLPAQVTIIFQDIEGFTTLSEAMDPINLARLTSEYMEIMTEIICKNGGTIDKYIGDCIMSIFNAPDELKGHQYAATKAAAECMKTLAQKNVEWREQYGCEINCRIGINCGEVLVGNMGGNNRMNYTVFGDNVNVAARLEGVNKYFGTRIIVSKSVASGVPQGVLAIRKLAKVRVSGKSQPTSIYEVRSITPTTNQLFALYKEALKAFKNREFVAASDKIAQTISFFPDDKASKMLNERIQTAMSEGVDEKWTYVEDLCKL